MNEFERPLIEIIENPGVRYKAKLNATTAIEFGIAGKQAGLENGYEICSRVVSLLKWGAEGVSEKGSIAGFIPGTQEGEIVRSNVFDAASRGYPDEGWVNRILSDFEKQEKIGALIEYSLLPETADDLIASQELTGIDSWDILFAHGVVFYKWGMNKVLRGGVLLRRDSKGLPKDLIAREDHPSLRLKIPMGEYMNAVKKWSVNFLPDAA